MRRHLIRGTTAIALSWLLAGADLAGAESDGVVVVEMEASGAMARGGIQVDDRVLACERGDLGWPVRAPFDLLECEWELEPRGPVTLWVVRDAQRLELIVPTGAWQADARPVFDSRDQALWQLGLSQIESGDSPPPPWRQLAGMLEQAGAKAAALWLLIEQADRLREAQRFDEAATGIAKVISLARTASSPRLELAALWAQRQLLEARGANLEIRLRNAESLVAASRATPERPLVECKMSYNLGFLQTEANRLDDAEDTLSSALDKVRATVPGGSHLQGRLEAYLANVALTAGDLDSAADRVQIATLTLEGIRPESPIHAWTYDILGNIESRRGHFQTAITAWDRQLAIYRALGLEAKTVFPLFNIGVFAERLGDFDRADVALAEATAVEERTWASQDSTMAARLFGQWGYLHLSWGRLDTASEYSARSHQLLERLGAKDERLARSLARLGHVARYRGDLDGAEGYYLRALSIHEERGDNHGIGAHLSNLGNLARQRKDYETALALYSRGLEAEASQGIARVRITRPRILSNIGRTHLLLGRAADAEPYLEESLALKLEESPETLDVAASLMLLGDLERSRENLDRAQARYRAALDLHSKLVPGRPAEAENQVRLGQLLLDLGDLSGAEPLLARAVATTELRASGTTLAADALYHLARLEVARGARKKGLDLHRRAALALDRQWQKLGGSRDARLSWMHAHADYYRAYLELLVEEGLEEDAFDLLQRYRARGLRDILARRDLDVPSNERAQAIERQLIDLAREREALLKRLEEASPEDELRALQTSLISLRSRRERLLAELRVAAPEVARLKYPSPMSLREVSAALDAGTTMISFSAGRAQTLAFVLRHDGDGQVYLDVKRLPIGRGALGQQVAAFRQSIERHLAGELDLVQQQGAALHDLLFRPLGDALAAAERILVVADGPLHGLPFAALRRNGRYLIDWKPIHLAPSATVYADLGRLVSSGQKSVAFGDPSFGESGDETHVVRGTRLRRLPGTRREVEAVRRELPPPVEIFVGAQATEERVKQLSNERLIHFASHAVVNEELPLDSALALARSPATRSPASGQENGRLYAWEVIEQMRLETSLVTLSACETALGREVEGEGILGLVWAFHYAGAKSVIASLWNVEDRSTSDLMSELYTGLASGLDKDQALRRAQLRQLAALTASASSTARGVGGLVPKDSLTTAHPFYWAAFQLYGSIHD